MKPGGAFMVRVRRQRCPWTSRVRDLSRWEENMAGIKVRELMRLALAQVDDKYVFGVEVSRTDPDPESFDCSEIIE